MRLMSSLRRSAGFLRRHSRAVFVWALGACFLFGGLLMLWAASLRIPDLSSIENRKVEQSLKIYDRTGTTLLYDLNKNIDRTVVPLSSISKNVQDATIATEDPSFYQNPGVVWTSIIRAFIADLTHLGAVQGGSTLTQQVVKLTILSQDKSISRKLKEVVLALKLTQTLPKDKILELYLNQAPYGGSLYGVEAASEQFFGVHAADLTVAQAAYLTAMLPAPTYYSPYGNHKDALDARKNFVLDRMLERGFLTPEQRDQAKAEQVAFLPQKSSGILAPHFVFYVEQYLEQKYGQDALQQDGWTVTTTLDANLQTHAEDVVHANALQNATKFNASNAGLIALDPNNGQILAMVGSRNYFDTEIPGNFNVTLALRQPGSTFKPFAYAEAFEKGYTPDTVVFDVPTQFQTTCSPDNLTTGNGCYSPVNFDDQFRGPMTLRDALAQSINVPAIKTLYLAGISDTLRFAKSLGISTLGSAGQYGLPLVLGGGEVTLLDMADAYGAFATNGMHYAPVAVLKITDQDGNVIEDNSNPVGTRVMPPNIAENINDILSDSVARAPLGENEYLSFPGHDVAAKTGTTNDFRDAWTIGYTPNIVVGIWAGNNDNTPMVKKVSGFIVGPMWNQFMRYALQNTPAAAFQRSDTADIAEAGLKPVLRGVWQGGDSTIIDSRTGQPATPATPAQFLQERVICDVHSILYWVDPENPNGPSPRQSATDPQYVMWEPAVENWARAHGCAPGSPVIVGAATPAMLGGPQTDISSSTSPLGH